MTGEPYSKERQLARGERRYRRKVASPRQWQAIIAAKRGPCRVCTATAYADPRTFQFHHLVPRDLGGDDVADNIVPVHQWCHDLVTRLHPTTLHRLARSLSPAERAYVVGKLGEDGLLRLFGATR